MKDCDVMIGRMQGSREGKVVRIDVKDGAKLLGRIEMSLENFAAASMGELIHARYTTDRNDQD